MHILSVVGARPQFVKLAPLSRELRKHHQEFIIHTGQHYDQEMSDLFFEQLDIPKPDINLDIGSGGHGKQTGAMLEGIEQHIQKHQPDWVISFGDTNSTLAACLAASKLEVPSLHIEAGLRSFNRSMPEEINRVVADHTADLLFAPSPKALENLSNEGLTARTILTGDIMVDAVAYVQKKVTQNQGNDAYQNYLLMTLHRPYNVDDPEKLSVIMRHLGELSRKLVFPVHPRTRNIMDRHNIKIPSNLELISPQGYVEFQRLLAGCDKVITDSGGLQKEAYLAGKPCITVRPETEWVETVEAGWNVLADPYESGFVEKVATFQPSSKRSAIYGTNVAEKMVSELKNSSFKKFGTTGATVDSK